MKRSINGLLVRFALLVIAVSCGWFAVAHAQKGLTPDGHQEVAQVPTPVTSPVRVEPMPDPNTGYAQAEPAQWTQPEPMAPVESPSYPAGQDAAEQTPSVQSPPEQNLSEPYPREQDLSEQYASEQFAPAQSPPEQPAAEQYAAAQPSAKQNASEQYAVAESTGTIQTTSAQEDLGYGDLPDLPLDVAPPAGGGAGYDAIPISDAPAIGEDDRFALPPSGQVSSELPSESGPVSPLVPALSAPAAEPLEPTSQLESSQSNYKAPSEPSVLESTTTPQITPGARFVPEPAPHEIATAPTLGARTPGTGKPNLALEGPQTPVLTLSKQAPREIQVGKPATFEITVRNSGSVTAHEVLIRDEIPYGTSLVETNPPADQSLESNLLWQVGEVAPGGESTVTMTVMPETEGEIGSVATVTFQAAASAQSISTRPQLTVEHNGPRKVLVGDDVVFHITLNNPGTGVASNVTIEEDVPGGLRHAAGAELEYQVGNLKPNETRVLELTLKADRPGLVENVLVARGDAGLVANHNFQLEVVAPLIQVGIKGPRRRYLEREARFEITLANPGTAAAKNVDLLAHMPSGLEYVSTNNAGQYDPQTHTVRWNLAELPPNEMGSVELVAKPRSIGDQKIRLDAKAQMNLADTAEHVVQVDGVAALLFTVKDLADPIEVGGQTSYEIRVVNQGSKAATNLRIGAIVPAGMQAIRGEGPVRGNVDGQAIVFEPLQRLLPQGETVYRVHVKGVSPGDKRMQVKLISDDLAQEVTKEESTHVYADE